MKRSVRFAYGVGAVAVLAMSSCGGGPGPACYYSLSLTGRGLPAMGGDVQAQVQAPAGCTWTYQGNDAWISVHNAPPAPSGKSAPGDEGIELPR